MSLPTDSTRPAISQPMTGCFGVRSPGIPRFHGAPLMWNKSRGFTDAAQSFIKTSLSLGVGFSTSVNCSTSGGPYCVRTIAFIEVLTASACVGFCCVVVAHDRRALREYRTDSPAKSLGGCGVLIQFSFANPRVATNLRICGRSAYFEYRFRSEFDEIPHASRIGLPLQLSFRILRLGVLL